MGMASYAKGVAETEHEVRYEVRESITASPSGVIVMDALQDFEVEGDRCTRILGAAVMAKRLRSVRENGSWPEYVQHVAG